MIGMKVEDHLDGATNFISWKSRVLLILEENDLLKLVNEKVPEPEAEEDKSHWRKSDARARRILVDSVRDHLVPQISQKKTTKKMFKTLKRLFEHYIINVTLPLRNQLSNMKMSKSEPIASYFMRIIELMDKLRSSGEPIDDKELIMTTLNGLPTSWESFIQTISDRTKLPKFDRLWANCTHEETRIVARQRLHGTQLEVNQVFMAHAKKG